MTQPAGLLQGLQGLAQTLVLDAQQIAEPGTRQHRAVGQERQDLLREAGGLVVVGFGDDFQMGRLGVGRHQFQVHRRRSGCGPVFAGQEQAILRAFQVEVGVAEGVQIAGAAEGLTGGEACGPVLPRVMHQDDRQVQLPLQARM